MASAAPGQTLGNVIFVGNLVSPVCSLFLQRLLLIWRRFALASPPPVAQQLRSHPLPTLEAAEAGVPGTQAAPSLLFLLGEVALYLGQAVTSTGNSVPTCGRVACGMEGQSDLRWNSSYEIMATRRRRRSAGSSSPTKGGARDPKDPLGLRLGPARLSHCPPEHSRKPPARSVVQRRRDGQAGGGLSRLPHTCRLSVLISRGACSFLLPSSEPGRCEHGLRPGA